MMPDLRIYGRSPLSAAVIHGGPGAAGEMAPVARRLSSTRGVLEPLQTASTLDGQVTELKDVLEAKGDLPVTLIGFSWGAMLSFILAARHPSVVRKLVLVGSPPFEEEYAAGIMSTRLNRLSHDQREDALSLLQRLEDPGHPDKNTLMARLGELLAAADSYDALPCDSEIVEYRHDIYKRVWEQAAKLRRSGKLLRLGEKIKCPAVAIHGDHDPHPGEGVRRPLSRVLKDFR
ncbi:MAG: alpha/beta hydrolase, partial [Dehalococcoidia bacterium]|nr:alpha/beta hydrolase [Dehalococcoidia bacterium]